MSLLIAGIALWWAGHLYKRLLPDLHARLGKGASAVIILAGLALIVIGFRGMDHVPVYTPPSWGVHLNNLLMLIAVILVGAGNSKSSLRRVLRHPMLTGVVVWAVAHLVANGDLAGVILFGSMAVWALVEMAVINAREPGYEPWQGGSIFGSVKLLAISAVVYLAIGGIHYWLGRWPFG